MKQTMKQWKLLAVVMILGGAMGLTSCSDDDAVVTDDKLYRKLEEREHIW